MASRSEHGSRSSNVYVHPKHSSRIVVFQVPSQFLKTLSLSSGRPAPQVIYDLPAGATFPPPDASPPMNKSPVKRTDHSALAGRLHIAGANRGVRDELKDQQIDSIQSSKLSAPYSKDNHSSRSIVRRTKVCAFRRSSRHQRLATSQ